MQSRISNLLAMGLMLAIGAAFLGWYYLHMATRSSRARQSIETNLSERARAEMPLPALSKFLAPDVVDRVEPSVATPPTLLEPAINAAAAGQAPQSTAPSQPTALQRRLSGAAFASAGTAAGGLPNPPANLSVATGSHEASSGVLSALLAPDPERTATARLMPNQRLLLPKGAFVDCTLETAIDSTLPGLTTCVTATDTFGADGTVVLFERGTKLLGETRGQVQQASTRVFVVWIEARTPKGVIVPLDSPGADELGRSGLPGQVERHFWERFGAAILVSTIDGGVQAAVQSASKGSGTVIYNPSGPQDVMGEVLKSTLSVAPTVIKRNGDRIQILVARDIDFSRVYELRHVTEHP